MASREAGSRAETVRGFWHGRPLGPYQLLCLRSFVDHGHHVEVFSYEDAPDFPDWITCGDARDILPTDRVLQYQQGFGRGSPALHSNLFRYALLRRLGGWWTDLDVLLLRPDLPKDEFFFAQAADGYSALNTSVMKMPAGHPVLTEAVRRCLAISEDAAVWGQTGPALMTELVSSHGLEAHVQSWQTTYPVPWRDVIALFDPRRREEVEVMCRDAIFLHMFNEIWRGAGVPNELGPPPGSFLSACFRQHDFGHRFEDVMNFENVVRWIGNRHDKITLEQDRIALEQSRSAIEQSRGAIEQDYRELQSRYRTLAEARMLLERRCQELEQDRQVLEQRIQALHAAQQAILTSTSWRLTEPLRRLVRFLTRSPDRDWLP